MFMDAPTVRDVLEHKQRPVLTIGPDEPIEAAARLLCDRHIGILVVTGARDRAEGVISERDIVRAVAKLGERKIEDQKVRDIMTANVIACGPDDFLTTVLGEMNERRIRHMPVLNDQSGLVGLVSLSDTLTFLKDNTTSLNEEVMWTHALRHL